MLVPVSQTPFRIGRGQNVELVLGSPRVSKVHAEIVQNGAGYLIRDLGSRNGTFINGEPVQGERLLVEGDVLHIAHRELTFVLAEVEEARLDATWAGELRPTDNDLFRHTRDLYRILRGEKVRAVFQAIVSLTDGAVFGFEALGRCTLPDIAHDTATLFRLASERNKSVPLARLMRRVTLDDLPMLPRRGERLFLNVHPDEMNRQDLLDELVGAKERSEGRIIVAEIHESVISQPGQMRKLKADLHARGIELAYDDFGAGTSRLRELAEVPPDFVKLDMGLIRDIDKSQPRQELVSALVKVMRAAGVRVVAEGIETAEEHQTCKTLGCDLGQGYLIRHPVAADVLRETWQ